MADNELVVAVVALLVSLVALLATFMQVLQQYYASATGYAQCNEKVMGEWAKSKSRRFSWEELRYEVEFDAPVIFVCPPSNTRGPVPDAKILLMDGTQTSLEETWTTSEVDLRKEYEKRSRKERIHTADNERASWLVLLLAVQQMESSSREWQEKQYRSLGPPGQIAEQHGMPPEPPSLKDTHTLTVALQRKRKSWDTMPATIYKPYGTTTMCHMVEMMAALGVYWKEFDRKRDRYQAEGNGFVVLGERISDLGLTFSFQVYGKCQFERSRVIPVDEVKELCFGYVPTIYQETLDRSRLGLPNIEPETMGKLQLASREEIAETLVAIGCTKNAARYFADGEGRTSHLFPLSFELLGMLGKTLHIRNSCFTYIPNPTPDRWDKRSFSLMRIMESYRALSENELPQGKRNKTIHTTLNRHISKILSLSGEKDSPADLPRLNALHAAIDDCDAVLTGKCSKNYGIKAFAPPVEAQKSHDHSPPKLDLLARRREIVQDVLRSHVQEVLRLLNDREEHASDAMSLYVPDFHSGSPRTSKHYERLVPGFKDVDKCGPDERQHRFMEVYFDVVRRHVVQNATLTTERRASFAAAPHNFAFRRRGSVASQSSIAVKSDFETDEPTATSPTNVNHGAEFPHTINATNGATVNTRDTSHSAQEGRDSDSNKIGRPTLASEAVSHDDIWCTLVFRMICWLMLHDFNKLDVQVSKSELLGSRMPVYIA